MGAAAAMIPRAALAALALATVCAPAARARNLVVATGAGPVADAQRSILLQGFAAAAGIAVQHGQRDGGIDELRPHKDPAGGWDVVLARGDELLAACDEGLLEKLDWSAIGGKDHYLAAAVSDCGVGAGAYSYVLAWDKDKFPGAPTWADFWDVAKYPGKRGLMRGPRANLEIALMADGVASGDVYRTLRTPEGIERAFRKLDQLRPYVVWWQTEDEAARMLRSGDVLMTSATNVEVVQAARKDHRNFAIQWAGSLWTTEAWAIPKGAPNARQAEQFLYFAGDSAIQARLAGAVPYAGLARGALDGLPPEVLANLSLAPANLQGALAVDEAFWRDNLDKLTQRFAAWLAH
jgi:putative spermidine/putrescine transport system substrate-binding protein